MPQERLLESCGTSDSDQHGYAVAFGGAVDATGRPQIVHGAPRARSPLSSSELIGEGAVTFAGTGERIYGDEVGDRFGASIAGGLDLDGADGRADLVIGAPGADDGGDASGSVYGVASDQARLYVLHGAAPGDELGASVAAAGDLDGDGRDDFLVGAPQRASGGAGYALVVSGATGAVLRTHAGNGARHRFGRGLARVADLDGDGRRDYAVGAPGAREGRGTVTVFSAASGAVLRVHWGAAVGDEFGYAISAGGDVDRDGRHDYVVGAPRRGMIAGGAMVFSSSSGTQLLDFAGGESDGRFGASVALARDFDGDGFGDVIVGEPGIEGMWQTSSSGTVKVYSGRDGALLLRSGGGDDGSGVGISVASGDDYDLDGLDDVIVGAVLTNDGYGSRGCVSVLGASRTRPYRSGPDEARYGHSLASIADLNGDGRREVVIGAPHATDLLGQRTGRVTVETVDGEILHTFYGASDRDALGVRVAGAGDLDGDGVEDVVASSADRIPASDWQGDAYVRAYSGATGAVLHHIDGANGRFGVALDGGHDVDGDGRDDFVVGDESGDGLVRVYSGATGAVLREFLGDAGEYDRVGASVALLDDIDSDGLADVAFGAPSRVGQSGQIFYVGMVEARSGASGALLGRFVANFNLLGISLEAVADLDGDGREDLVVGSNEASFLTSWGSVHAISTGTFQELWRADETTNYDGITFGYALARTGDHDGDGVGDVLVGGPGENTPGARAIGSAYVYSGRTGTRLRRVTGHNGWDYLGYTMTGLGDQNEDGLPDFAVGAPTEPNNEDRGAVGLGRVRFELSNPLESWNYCPFAPGGGPALLTATGSSSLALHDVTLLAQALPTNSFAAFGMGTEAAAVVVGSSWMCLGGIVQRVSPAMPTGAGGEAELALDLSPLSVLGISAGTSWSFQAFFRAAGGAFGTTDAIRIRFQP